MGGVIEGPPHIVVEGERDREALPQSNVTWLLFLAQQFGPTSGHQELDGLRSPGRLHGIDGKMRLSRPDRPRDDEPNGARILGSSRWR